MISVSYVNGSLIIIEFVVDKTKFILFETKRKLRKASKLNIFYQGTDIK